MSKTWKWIIGTLLALVVLAVFVAVPFGMHQFAGRYARQFQEKGNQQGLNDNVGPGGQVGEYNSGPCLMRRGQGDFDEFGPGMMRRGYGYPGGMMGGGFGFFHFGGLFMGLIGLAVLGLAVYGVVALFNRRPAPAVVPAPVSPVSTHTCANCGKPAQDEWKTCPYCGTSL